MARVQSPVFWRERKRKTETQRGGEERGGEGKKGEKWESRNHCKAVKGLQQKLL
jgi:hypothetical protein